MSNNNILVTGACGFIGSNFIHLYLKENPNDKIIILDKMTYAANIDNLSDVLDKVFIIQGDICDKDLVFNLIKNNKINRVYNFAAESHVDNSISDPESFIRTNINGTFNLLHCSLQYCKQKGSFDNFKFLHVSTDEVYGSLEIGDGKSFTEESNYAPNSPYSASKASSDHIVRSFVHTYGLPCVITNCTNNYGIYQHSEKFIPKVIRSCMEKKAIPIYGDGMAIRDWIWAEDHSKGIMLAMENGKSGEYYAFGGDCQMHNIDVVKTICTAMNELYPSDIDYNSLISYVKDRPGHDMKYAIDSSKSKKELGFKQSVKFEDAIKIVIKYYINKAV